MFEERKQYKKLEQRYQAALEQGLPGIGKHVMDDTENLIAGNEEMVSDDPGLITGPQGIASGEWDLKSFGWLVLTNKRLNFMRIDGDRVRVAFLDDLTLDHSDGPFDTYKWQDRAQLRLISFGFTKGATTRTELAARSKT